MQIKGDNLLNKLILLFVFDKMEAPLSVPIIDEICCTANDWIAYMDCRPTLSQLIDNAFVSQVTSDNNPLFAITPDGRMCLADFFIKIPTSTRENISRFAKLNRAKYRRKQEFKADYFSNKDNTCTVYLRITEAAGTQFELKFIVPNRQIAKSIYKKWEDKAEIVYTSIYETLVE